MALLPIKIPPGFFRNATQYQAKNRWYNGNLVRFSEGRLRPIGGWQRLAPTQLLKKGLAGRVIIKSGGSGYSAGTLTATGGGGSNFAASFTVATVGGVAGVINAVTVTNKGSGYTSQPTLVFNNAGNSDADISIYFHFGVDPIRGFHSWRLSNGARYLAIGTVQSLRIWDGSQVSGASAPVFDVTPTSVPTGNIPFNSQEDFQISGLGFGALEFGGDRSTANTADGGDFYGVSRHPPIDADILDPDAWRDNFSPIVTIDNFSDDCLFCHSGEGTVFKWTVNGASFNNAAQTASVATQLTNAPTSNVGVLVTQERHVMCLGAGGNQRKIEWSSQDSLTDWTPSVTNTAGGIEIQSKGRILGGFKTRYGILLFFTDSVHKTKFLGPPYQYGTERLSEGSTCLGIKSVAGSADFVAWVSKGRFWSFTGGYITELECDVADYVFSDINTDIEGLIAAGHNGQFGEITWYFPKEGDTKNTRYVTYSYREKHWVTGDLERSQWESADSLGYCVAGGTDGYLYRHEMDNDTQSTPLTRADGVSPPADVAGLSTLGSRVMAKGVGKDLFPNVENENHLCFAETGAIELGNGDNMMSVSQIITDSDAGENGLRMSVEVRETPDDDTPITKGPYKLEGDGYTDTRFTGRQAVLKISSPHDQDWRLGEQRLQVSKAGRR